MAKTITELLDAAQTGEEFALALNSLFEGLSPDELEE